MRQEGAEPSIAEKLKEARDAKLAVEAGREATRQALSQDAVKEMADMAEGNQRLQKDIRDERFTKGIQRQDYVPGFAEAERKQEWEIKDLQYSISELEKERIPALEKEISITRQPSFGEDEKFEEILAAADVELVRLKEVVKQKKQELAEASRAAVESRRRHHDFTREQAAAAENNIGFAVDTVLAQREKSGQPLELKRDDMAAAVNRELFDRRKRKEEEENKKKDGILEKGQTRYLEKVTLDLDELRKAVRAEFAKFDRLTIGGSDPEFQAFWQPIRDKAHRIVDLLSQTFWIGKEKKERQAVTDAKALKKEIETVLDDLRKEIRDVSEKCYQFKRKHFRLPLEKGPGIDSSLGETVYLGLDADNFYSNAAVRDKMNGKREEIKTAFENFEKHVTREIGKYLTEVNRFAPTYPEKLGRTNV